MPEQTYNSRMFNLKNIFLGGGTELDDISSGDEENDDYDVDEELVPSANSICDEPDCDHTPERNQCSYNIPSHSNATNKISPHIKSYRTNQSNRNNPNNKTLVKSRGGARNVLASVLQRVALLSPLRPPPKARKNGKGRKQDTSSFSSISNRVNSALQSCCCLPISNFLGKWRFTRNFEWYSTTKYDNRLFSIGNKVTRSLVL